MMPSRTALVFPGQGSQRPGMLEALPQTEALVRLLDAADALAGLELRSVASEGPAERLAETRYAQPLLFLADWAWGKALLDGGVNVSAVAGHSLGELAALAVAGVVSVEAGLELVVARSQFMARAAREHPGTMAAVLGLDRPEIAAALEGIEGVWLANDNAPGQGVISGTLQAVATASTRLGEAGARRVVALNVAGPFHSPLMGDARDQFAELVTGAVFRDAAIPVYQNTDPTPATDGAVIRQRLLDQIISPVRWAETLDAFVHDGITLVAEAGPGSILTGLTRRRDGLSGVAVETAGISGVLEEVTA